MILQLVAGSSSIRRQRIQHKFEESKTIYAFTYTIDTENTCHSPEKQIRGVIVVPIQNGQIRDHLLREMTVKEVVLGLAEEVLEKGKTIVDLNIHLPSDKIKAEIWRKKRAGLHIFSNYIFKKKLELPDILNKRADVILANCLTLREKQERKSKLEELRKIRIHVGVALN
ncbi:MAG: hypothetical protein EZS28_030054, partial [Streblomastix strix]